MVVAEGQLGWSHLQEGRWKDARTAFETAVVKEPSAEVLHGLGDALWWEGEVEASIPHYQRAYAAYRDAGATIQAAMVAFTLAMTYKCCLGNVPAASGWISRAETVASQGDPRPMQGWIWAFRGYLAAEQDLETAEMYHRKARDHAVQTGDRDLELVALSSLGEVFVKQGIIEEGMSLIDEAMAGLSAGEHSRKETLVIVCCSMLIGCHAAADIRRAQDWIRIADQFVDQFGSLYLFAECRVLYGSLLFATGRWAKAKQELQKAIDGTKSNYPVVNSKARARLACIRICEGELEDAEQLLAGGENDIESLPDLALLKLEREDPATALQLTDRYLRHVDSRNVTAALALQIRVAAFLSTGDIAAAEGVLASLTAMTEDHAWPEVSGRTNMAAGWVALARNDSKSALGRFEGAMSDFSRIGMVYESACARLAAASVLSDFNPELAAIEAEGTLATFEKLGARPDAGAASALLRKLGQHGKPGPRTGALLSQREEEVLRLISHGLSNPEIADRLVISRKTAAHHVSNLLSKLGLRNRAEAVAYAARVGGSRA